MYIEGGFNEQGKLSDYLIINLDNLIINYDNLQVKLDQDKDSLELEHKISANSDKNKALELNSDEIKKQEIAKSDDDFVNLEKDNNIDENKTI